MTFKAPKTQMCLNWLLLRAFAKPSFSLVRERLCFAKFTGSQQLGYHTYNYFVSYTFFKIKGILVLGPKRQVTGIGSP